MRRGIIIVAGALLVLPAGVLAAAMIGRYSFNRGVAADVRDLFQHAAAAEPAVLTDSDIAHLPEPVQRWLDCRSGQPVYRVE